MALQEKGEEQQNKFANLSVTIAALALLGPRPRIILTIQAFIIIRDLGCLLFGWLDGVVVVVLVLVANCNGLCLSLS